MRGLTSILRVPAWQQKHHSWSHTFRSVPTSSLLSRVRVTLKEGEEESKQRIRKCSCQRAVENRTMTVDSSISSREALKQAFIRVIPFRTGTSAAPDWQRGQNMAPARREMTESPALIRRLWSNQRESRAQHMASMHTSPSWSCCL